MIVADPAEQTADRVERIGDSVVHHGPASDRVYAMKLACSDMPEVLEEFEGLAESEGYGKLVLKAHGRHRDDLDARGYRTEACIPDFFGHDVPGLFAGKFLDESRAEPGNPERIRDVLATAREAEPSPPEADSLRLREGGPLDADAIAAIYREVFATYPFPIHDPRHIRREMANGTRFFTAWDGDRLVAASSMEPGGAPGAVEMTDFATLPACRGRGLATRLLAAMERGARAAGVRVAFTIARARSYGMNITFGRRGYGFRGTLVNNTQIAGSIESMNVWSKTL